MSKPFLAYIKKHWLIIGIFLLGFLTYAPSLNNELFWDDEQFIYKNQHVIQFDVKKIFTTNTLDGAGELSNYYRPLTTLSFAFDHALWGMRPFGFHLTNSLLHSLSGVVLFFLLTTLKMKKKPAAVIAAFFLIHPLQTEAVVYANSRGDSHFTFYMLLGLLAFSVLLQKRKYTIQLYNLSYTLGTSFFATITVVLFIASILAKEIALGSIVLFMLVYTYHLTEIQKKHTGKIGATVLAGMTLALAAYGWLRATALLFQEQVNQFAGTPYGDSVFVRIATFAKVLLIYISLILVPVNLHMERTTEVITSAFSPYMAIVLLLLFVGAFLAYHEHKQLHTKWISFGLVWFLGMLIPVSGIVPLNDIMYEHWLYVPLIGFFILSYGCIHLALEKFKLSWPRYTQAFLICIGSIYILLTLRQNYIWGKATRFYPYILQYQQTARIHNNLAMAYADEGRLADAMYHYQRAIELLDIYPQTHHNLAKAYLAVGDTEKALDEFTIAITMNPDFLVSYPELIQLHLAKGEIEIAETYLKRIETTAPEALVVAQLKTLLEVMKKNLNSVQNQR